MKSHPYLFLAAIFALLFLAGNELAAVTDTAESNYALTAREMVLSGDWMSPRIYGHYWYDKPIFFYWELALSFADFGFNEFAARLPSAVFGVASVLYTFWFSSKVYDRKTGWTAALILGTSLEFWLLSKAVVTDAALFFFMSVSIASFYLGYREDRKYYFLCYAAAALAVLTKGPIGLALPGLSAILFLLWRRDLREMLHVRLISGMVLFLLLCAPWYIYMTVYHGTDFLLNFFGVHNYLRATVAEHQSTAHWWFYIAMYFAGMIPLASAMNTSGAGKLIAEYTVAALGGNPSPYVITAVLFILAVVLTQFMSNTASKALLCPVGIALAAQVGASPRAVLMAILIASSCAFASPVGTPPNTLVLGPGKYSFMDFVKCGTGLVVICLVVSIAVIPVVWPFFPN